MATLTVPIFRRLAQLGLCLSACVTLACNGGTASVDGGRGGDTGAAGGAGGGSNTGGIGAGGSGSQGSGGAIVPPPDGGGSGGSGGTAAAGGRGGSGGASNSGGATGSGGTAGSGGTKGTGGTNGSGGLGGLGGAPGPVACPTMSTAAATTSVTLDGNNVVGRQRERADVQGLRRAQRQRHQRGADGLQVRAPGAIRDAASDPVRRHQSDHDAGQDRDG